MSTFIATIRRIAKKKKKVYDLIYTARLLVLGSLLRPILCCHLERSFGGSIEGRFHGVRNRKPGRAAGELVRIGKSLKK